MEGRHNAEGGSQKMEDRKWKLEQKMEVGR